MRRGFAFLLAACMIVSLAACSSDVTIPTRSPENTKKASETPAVGDSSPAASDNTQTAQQPAESVPAATAAVTEAETTEAETEPPHIPPRTAEKAPALMLADLPNPVGEGTLETDPESGAVVILVEDLGEDGHTYTRNCFDEAGNLLWYECCEYNDDEQAVCVLRKDAEEKIIARDLLIREGELLVRKEHYDCRDYGAGEVIDELGYEEDYYPNGQVAARTAYGSYTAQGKGKELTEYSEDGKETHRAVYDGKGTLLEEYRDGKKVILVPDSLQEIFFLLNEAPDEEFEETWEACMAHLEKKGLTEKWDDFCRTLSALLDEYNGSSLYWLREEYGLKLFPTSRNKFLFRNNSYGREALEPTVKNGPINPLLFAKVYRMGCWLDIGGTIWLPMEFSMAMSDGSVGGLSVTDDGTPLFDWSNNHLRAFAMNTWGIDPLPDYQAAKEAIPEEGMDYGTFCSQLTQTLAEKIGTDPDTMTEEYLAALMDAAEELDAAAERAEGAPIRILILDSSETYRGDEITREALASSEESLSADVVERDQQIIEDVFGLINTEYRVEKLMLISYPELADVIVELNVTHPYAGHYQYSDGTPADVWNTVITLTAYDLKSDNSVSVVFKHIAGDTVSVTGGTKIYMRIPDLEDEEYSNDAKAFVNTIFSWYPDLEQ